MKTNNPDYLTASSGTTHLKTDLTSNMETKTNQAADNVATETKFKLTDKVQIINHERIYERYDVIFKKLRFKNTDMNIIPKTELKGTWEVFGISKHEYCNKVLVAIRKGAKEILIQDIGLRLIESSQSAPAKLKNATQQKRVELIETQKWELLAATATIDNQAATIKTFEKAFEIKDRTIKKQSDELEKLGETCGNLVRTKLRNESSIADLTKRNGNLKTITNDQTERIEVMQNELKNYESVVEVYENRISNFKTENKWLQNDISNLKTKNEMQTESRERLASKLTNWFLFLVTVIIIEAVFLVKMALENGSKP